MAIVAFQAAQQLGNAAPNWFDLARQWANRYGPEVINAAQSIQRDQQIWNAANWTLNRWLGPASRSRKPSSAGPVGSASGGGAYGGRFGGGGNWFRPRKFRGRRRQRWSRSKARKAGLSVKKAKKAWRIFNTMAPGPNKVRALMKAWK